MTSIDQIAALLTALEQDGAIAEIIALGVAHDDPPAKIADKVIDVVMAALAAAPAQPQGGGGWRLIETAPKDGTRILVCDHMLISLARRHDTGGTYETWVHAPYNAENTGEPIYYDPTHWQPLPTLPNSIPAAAAQPQGGDKETVI